MDSACPEKDVTEISSNSDHSTKVAPTTLRKFLSLKQRKPKKDHINKSKYKRFLVIRVAMNNSILFITKSSTFLCNKLIWHVLKTKPQKIEAILIIRPRSNLLHQ